ncbi:PTS sugar transporter subunit IIA [Anaerostipes sp.]|uniref:PTS sugar transporter subunit IIA n=1 Tax=Anaerostipes sp. TaxID=1872530 RepID=UPI0025795790|nr:PTS sugar transporter subunit IIA [Anaerostipes sp.]
MPQIIGYKIRGKERDEVLHEMADYLADMGMVKSTYGQSVINRENEFPTGICTEPNAVAIPHCERDGVLKTAILVGQPGKEGITFERIDADKEYVNAKAIFMLAVDTDQGQLEVISRLMDVIQNEKVIQGIIDAKTCEDIKEIVTNAFENASTC